ncbi:hypothetical protein CR513_13826, partial [Mucuna pruriens]
MDASIVDTAIASKNRLDSSDSRRKMGEKDGIAASMKEVAESLKRFVYLMIRCIKFTVAFFLYDVAIKVEYSALSFL